MNEKVLGHFLRYKRTHADRAKFDVPDIKHRTPGLTRDEVATLANVSTDWYIRIEQGRTGVSASADVLRDLCKTLKLNQAETNYIFNLAEEIPPTTDQSTSYDSVQRFVDEQMPNPAFALDQNLTVVAANKMYTAIYGNFLAESALRRHLVFRTFNDPHFRAVMVDWENYASALTAKFRQLYSRTPDSKVLFEVYSAVKDDPVFKQTWDQLKVEELGEERLLLNVPNAYELYLIETFLKLLGAGDIIGVQLPGDEETRKRLGEMVND